ncbi:hypothetical protein EDEG_02739 [Edhazardia aedis USNM 41457]|uniref:GATA-type domain-containing protein n=1 Tax=Edhazardia aedis (strain USNM 41457) TaxID=1003232 RepID=J9D5N6_EDHAE|nr:hypothetical protein EDEG_02739 [Edhazardia aedis USNM 41457]|eukprot:EJW02859.1 hypothetical protein EDEG_02739 [Edhazardia aedis USNM 41457]
MSHQNTEKMGNKKNEKDQKDSDYKQEDNMLEKHGFKDVQSSLIDGEIGDCSVVNDNIVDHLKLNQDLTKNSQNASLENEINSGDDNGNCRRNDKENVQFVEEKFDQNEIEMIERKQNKNDSSNIIMRDNFEGKNSKSEGYDFDRIENNANYENFDKHKEIDFKDITIDSSFSKNNVFINSNKTNNQEHFGSNKISTVEDLPYESSNNNENITHTHDDIRSINLIGDNNNDDIEGFDDIKKNEEKSSTNRIEDEENELIKMQNMEYILHELRISTLNLDKSINLRQNNFFKRAWNFSKQTKFENVFPHTLEEILTNSLYFRYMINKKKLGYVPIYNPPEEYNNYEEEKKRDSYCDEISFIDEYENFIRHKYKLYKENEANAQKIKNKNFNENYIKSDQSSNSEREEKVYNKRYNEYLNDKYNNCNISLDENYNSEKEYSYSQSKDMNINEKMHRKYQEYINYKENNPHNETDTFSYKNNQSRCKELEEKLKIKKYKKNNDTNNTEISLNKPRKRGRPTNAEKAAMLGRKAALEQQYTKKAKNNVIPEDKQKFSTSLVNNSEALRYNPVEKYAKKSHKYHANDSFTLSYTNPYKFETKGRKNYKVSSHQYDLTPNKPTYQRDIQSIQEFGVCQSQWSYLMNQVGTICNIEEKDDSQNYTDSKKGLEPVCSHCGTNDTSLWRKVENKTVCNACGLYYKMHGVKRPGTLKRYNIKKRRRPHKKVSNADNNGSDK